MILKNEPGAIEMVNTLSDNYSRRIVLEIISKTQSIEELSKGLYIPVSTRYRKVRIMLKFGIARLVKTVIDADGKEICFVRQRVSRMLRSRMLRSSLNLARL